MNGPDLSLTNQEHAFANPSSRRVSTFHPIDEDMDKSSHREVFASTKNSRSYAWMHSRRDIQHDLSLKLRRFRSASSRYSAHRSYQFNVDVDETDARDSTHVPKQYKVEEEITDYRATLRDYLDMASYEINYVKCVHNLSIMAITAVSLIGYLFLVSLFAVVGYLIDQDDICINVGGNDEEEKFRNYFALSWHIFSTVGYGHIHPERRDGPASCIIIAYLFFIESFVGVMYAGLCGALLYSRITKALDHADVMFSNGICISYCDSQDFPVLELRIVNCRANVMGGEIIDASVDCLIGLKGWANDSKRQMVVAGSEKSLQANINSLKKQKYRKGSTRLVSKRWSKNHLQAHSNPQVATITQPSCRYFSRIWSVRHILDGNSSLLLPSIKSQIKENNGKWPENMLSKETIVTSLVPFREIIVTISGISVETGKSVFSCKTYGLSTIFSGYKFADMLCEDCSDGNIKVDFELLSDIIEE